MPLRHGNAHPNIVPYQVFATADGHVIVAVGNDGQFAVPGAGLRDLAAMPDYATNPARLRAPRGAGGDAVAAARRAAMAEVTARLEARKGAGGAGARRWTRSSPATRWRRGGCG